MRDGSSRLKNPVQPGTGWATVNMCEAIRMQSMPDPSAGLREQAGRWSDAHSCLPGLLTDNNLNVRSYRLYRRGVLSVRDGLLWTAELLERDVAGIGALVDPVRRQLYHCVSLIDAGEPRPGGRRRRHPAPPGEIPFGPAHCRRPAYRVRAKPVRPRRRVTAVASPGRPRSPSAFHSGERA